MPTLMPTDTRVALGPNAEKCDSRSLLLDRFVDPTAKEAARKNIFTRAFDKPAIRTKANLWPPFVTDGLGLRLGDLLFARLQARLMVNMAGGVMENAGLCLDRFGIPYIPGSAVKGCARRMAIQQLFESGAGFQPAQPEDVTAKSQRWDQCAQLLVQIARVFGWGDLDWSSRRQDGRFISDFAYACGADDWEEIRERAAKLLFEAFPNWKPNPKRPLWESLPNFAGSVSFLPAYPIQAPNPDLELDVVTCHHREYYNGNPAYASAPDTEEPVPVVFPAVAPSHVFVFAVVPLRYCDAALLQQARDWLKAGLETFGLGAKTNAGYGWFDCSDRVQQATRTAIEVAERRREEERRRKQEEERRRAEEEERRRKAEEMKKQMASMTPEQRADYELAQLTDDQFRARLDNFSKLDAEEQKAIVRALRLAPEQPGSRRKSWDELKTKAQKGGKPAQIEQAVRQLSKQMYPGKEGKMP